MCKQQIIMSALVVLKGSYMCVMWASLSRQPSEAQTLFINYVDYNLTVSLTPPTITHHWKLILPVDFQSDGLQSFRSLWMSTKMIPVNAAHTWTHLVLVVVIIQGNVAEIPTIVVGRYKVQTGGRVRLTQSNSNWFIPQRVGPDLVDS